MCLRVHSWRASYTHQGCQEWDFRAFRQFGAGRGAARKRRAGVQDTAVCYNIEICSRDTDAGCCFANVRICRLMPWPICTTGLLQEKIRTVVCHEQLSPSSPGNDCKDEEQQACSPPGCHDASTSGWHSWCDRHDAYPENQRFCAG